ncbi:3-hydroxyacyl-ACP dehydratase FabZ family protein [Ramlibacter sp.]|uniref:3-hydroxyacyl-ACP dehydratase FabZ family protein n=1 Tax=Ramlibacter sp. TaxID=1917967 RepID=UPI0017B2824E|nr:3-hydroxyacyl-ACP dehydratase FabZ family protein [Ramlibacter sp.]MBA2672711.1 beta-hydroxyacyl-ACP dehydratase [Ramlibacter sp.]
MLATAATTAIEDPAAWLSHRPPFLFVDRADAGEDRLSLRAQRRFPADEAFFSGHFPGEPVVPGVILIELLAQAANLLLSWRAGHTVRGYLVGVEGAKFNQTVHPGQLVNVDIRFAEPPRPVPAGAARFSTFHGVAHVDQRRCMRAAVNIYHIG